MRPVFAPNRHLRCSSRARRSAFVGALVGVVMAAFGESAAGQARHGIAMHGEPALPSDFRVLRYANPAAPKGGRLIQGVLGTFDSLNPLIVKGLVLSQIRGYVIESLLARNYDEPFSLYGLLARTVETDADRSYVIFNLDPNAKFSDGRPVTVEDVIFFLAIAARQRPGELLHLLFKGYQGRGGRSARCGSISPARMIASCRLFSG